MIEMVVVFEEIFSVFDFVASMFNKADCVEIVPHATWKNSYSIKCSK